jgi:hypothetical protein
LGDFPQEALDFEMNIIDINQALDETADLDGKVEFVPRIPQNEDKYMPVLPDYAETPVVPKQKKESFDYEKSLEKKREMVYRNVWHANNDGLIKRNDDPEVVLREACNWDKQKAEWAAEKRRKRESHVLESTEPITAPTVIPAPAVTNPTRVPVVPKIVKHKKGQTDIRKYVDRAKYQREYQQKLRAQKKNV